MNHHPELTADEYIEEVLSLFEDFPDGVRFALNLSKDASEDDVIEAAYDDYQKTCPVWLGHFEDNTSQESLS